MCISCTRLPLVKLKDGKRKVLFDVPIQYESREDIEHAFYLKDELKKALNGTSVLSSLNVIAKRNDVSEVLNLVSIPCGKCSECLTTRAREWAFRIMVETERFDNNYFVTLTYDDEHCPRNMMLQEDMISKFNKKLKTYLKRNNLPSDFRYYGIGEYGGISARPHYHVIYFNLVIPDLVFQYQKDGKMYFSSEFLSSVWNNGFIVISDVDVGCASYVARYCDKKKLLTNEQKDYLRNIKGIIPEYSSMSRRPGIGSYYTETILQKVRDNIRSLQMKDVSFSIPLYYSKKLENLLTPEEYSNYKEESLKHQMIKAYQHVLDYEKINKDGFHESLWQFLAREDRKKILNKKARKN